MTIYKIGGGELIGGRGSRLRHPFVVKIPKNATRPKIAKGPSTGGSFDIAQRKAALIVDDKSRTVRSKLPFKLSIQVGNRVRTLVSKIG